MENKLEVKQIVEQIKGAFGPLECKAESWDYKVRIRFKVLYKGKTLYERKEVLTTELDSPERFVKYVNAVRQVVCKKMRETVPSFEFDDPDPIVD